MRLNFRPWVIAALLAAAFGVNAEPAQGALSLSANAPAAVTDTDTSFVLKVGAGGEYQILSVTADLDGTAIPMTKVSTKEFQATVDITGRPRGAMTLTVTALNAAGETSTVTKTIYRDTPPVLTLDEPFEGIVAEPKFHAAFHCSTTGVYGCKSVRLNVPGTSYGLTGSVFSRELDRYGFTASLIELMVTSDAGLSTTVSGTVVTQVSPNAKKINEVDGPILDVDSTRILYRGFTGIAIKNRNTGAVTVLSSDKAQVGHLTSTGAVWPEGTFRNGVLFPRTPPLPLASFHASGDWLVGRVTGGWIRENTTTGASYPFSATNAKVGRDGSMVVELSLAGKPNTYYRSPAGVDTLISTNATLSTADFEGDLVRVGQSGGGSGGLWSISTASFLLNRYTHPYLAGGWVAFVGASYHRWTRSPAGELALAEPFEKSVPLVGLSPLGEVVVDDVENGHRYVTGAAPPTTKPLFDIGAPYGTMYWLDGAWHNALGRVLYRIGTATKDPGGDLVIGPGGGGGGGGAGGGGGGGVDAGGGGGGVDAGAGGVDAGGGGADAGGLDAGGGGGAGADAGGVDAGGGGGNLDGGNGAGGGDDAGGGASSSSSSGATSSSSGATSSSGAEASSSSGGSSSGASSSGASSSSGNATPDGTEGEPTGGVSCAMTRGSRGPSGGLALFGLAAMLVLRTFTRRARARR